MIRPLPVPTLQSQFLTPKKFAWVLDVTEFTVRRWMKKKLIPVFRFGGQIQRIEAQAGVKFIFEHTIQNIAPIQNGQLAPLLNPDQFELLAQRLERFLMTQLDAKNAETQKAA